MLTLLTYSGGHCHQTEPKAGAGGHRPQTVPKPVQYLRVCRQYARERADVTLTFCHVTISQRALSSGWLPIAGTRARPF